MNQQFTQFIALFALVALQAVVTLGNYWITYGLWPRNWFAFVFFGITSALLYGLINLVSKAK